MHLPAGIGMKLPCISLPPLPWAPRKGGSGGGGGGRAARLTAQLPTLQRSPGQWRSLLVHAVDLQTEISNLEPPPALTGKWRKCKKASDPMDDACEMVALPWVLRKAIAVLNTLEVSGPEGLALLEAWQRAAWQRAARRAGGGTGASAAALAGDLPASVAFQICPCLPAPQLEDTATHFKTNLKAGGVMDVIEKVKRLSMQVPGPRVQLPSGSLACFDSSCQCTPACRAVPLERRGGITPTAGQAARHAHGARDAHRQGPLHRVSEAPWMAVPSGLQPGQTLCWQLARLDRLATSACGSLASAVSTHTLTKAQAVAPLRRSAACLRCRLLPQVLLAGPVRRGLHRHV